MKAMITVIGKDRVGIIARVSGALADGGINILDITQTILNDHFTMIMAVEVPENGLPFVTIQKSLENLGREMHLSIRIQRTDIFDAMHTI